MFRISSGIFMGWSLGSNNSANIFGTAVASKTIRYSTAVILCSLFILGGALLGGAAGMQTIGNIVKLSVNTAFIASLAAAVTVTGMTAFKLPASASQAVIGAILGIGFSVGGINISGLSKVIIVWIGTPTGTVLISLVLYPLVGKLLNSLPINIFTRDYILKAGLVIAGCYAAYSLGANNVANVTGIYSQTGLLSIEPALLIGGLSIVLGVITYSKRVMMTVGKNLVKLDPFSAFITVLSQAVVLDIYARIGVPTSSSQAIIGAVVGIGLLKGAQTINFKTLVSIFCGWLGTPLAACILAYAGFYLFRSLSA